MGQRPVSTTEGKNVRAWTEGFEDEQWQSLDWGDTLLVLEPRTFPKNGHDRLSAWLKEAFKGKLPTAMRKELSREVSSIKGSFAVEWVVEGHGPVMLPRMAGTPLAVAALGVMALASPELHDGFGQCEWCERYFLEIGVRRGPAKRRYCPDRGCNNAARQNKYRRGTGKREGL